jgi:transposase-like protein
LEKALAAVWEGVPIQRCTVHKHRNLLAHAPERLHEEVTADYTDMIYAATPKEIETRRKAFIRKWRLRHRPVAASRRAASSRFASTANSASNAAILSSSASYRVSMSSITSWIRELSSPAPCRRSSVIALSNSDIAPREQGILGIKATK